MNDKDPIIVYLKLIQRNGKFFMFLLLLAILFSYLTFNTMKMKSTSSVTLKYESSYMQVTPLDPIYFSNFQDFRLHLKDNYYLKFVRNYVKDFKKKCSMGNYPEEFIIVDIPGMTNNKDYKLNFSSITLNYFRDYEYKIDKCIKKVFNDFKLFENDRYLNLFKKIYTAENIEVARLNEINKKSFNNGFETNATITDDQLNYFFFRDMLVTKDIIAGLDMPAEDESVLSESLKMLSNKMVTNSTSKILIRFEPMQIFSIKSENPELTDNGFQIFFIYLIIFFVIGLILLFVNKNFIRLSFLNK